MITLKETKRTYSIIIDDNTYTLVQYIFPNSESYDVLDKDGKQVDDNTWNNVLAYFNMVVE